MPVVILKGFLDDIKGQYTPEHFVNFLNKQKVYGADHAIISVMPDNRKGKFDPDLLLVEYKDFKLDAQGNITARLIKYGDLKNYDDNQIAFVIRAFVNHYTHQINLVAIDVKYG